MLRMKEIIPFVVITLSFLIVGCGGGNDGEERYLMTGSSTIAPIMAEVATHLGEKNPHLKIDVQMGGSTRGIADTHDGRNNAGMASKTLSPDEAKGLDIHTIAYDGIAIIVHAKNPITELSSDQARQLFTKKIDQWEKLGAHKGPVRVINKAEGRATLEVFLKHFGLKNEQIQADAVIGDNAQGVRLVAGDPQAIGYISIGEALSAEERGVPIKMLALDGVRPTSASIADGSYQVLRPLNLLFREKPDHTGQEILAFLRTNDGQHIIRGLGFVPAGPVE